MKDLGTQGRVNVWSPTDRQDDPVFLLFRLWSHVQQILTVTTSNAVLFGKRAPPAATREFYFSYF